LEPLRQAQRATTAGLPLLPAVQRDDASAR
jgi:hypothetical protein